MRILDIIESIDQKDADEVLKGLVATGDSLTAKYFMQTRHDSRHRSIDSAQRAAERMARVELDRQQPVVQKSADQAKPSLYTKPTDKKSLDKKTDKPGRSAPTSVDTDTTFTDNPTTKFKSLNKFMTGYNIGARLANKYLGK